MKAIFAGLFFYELILLIAGILLFAVLLWQAIKQGFNVTLGSGFLISLVFIGYPGIKSFSISKDTVTVNTAKEALQENPQDKTAKAEMKEALPNLEARATTADELVTVSTAHLTLGDNAKANQAATEALEKDPENQKAKEVIQVIAVDKTLEKLRLDTSNAVVKAELKRKIRALEQVPTQTSNKTTTLAESYLLLNEVSKAQLYIDSTEILQPKNNKVKELNRSIQSRLHN